MKVTYTTTNKKSCRHDNGWYETLKFLWFTNRFFVCTDCKTLIKRMEE